VEGKSVDEYPRSGINGKRRGQTFNQPRSCRVD
jgi:hypothetical protein